MSAASKAFIMNVTTKSNLFLAATLAAFALTACAGSDDTAPGAGASNANEGASPKQTKAASPSASSPSVPATNPTAGTNTPTAPTPTRIALQCTGPQAPTTNVICLETAEGRAGDTVDLEVHLVRTAACGPAEYAFGSFQIDPAKFEIMNRDNQPDCLQRDQYTSFSDPNVDVITWQAFDKSVAPASCTASAGVGNVDVIKVRIKPGTAAGDYDLPFESSELLGGGPGCSGVSLHVASKIRVLP